MTKRAWILLAIAILALMTLGARNVPGFKNVVTDYAHHENHDGNYYSVSANQAALASGGKILFLVNTADSTTHAHMALQLSSSAESYVQIWRTPTVSALGAAVTAQNRNLTSSNTAITAITFTPTVTNAGALLNGLTQHIGAGREGGFNLSDTEIILNSDSLYLINVVSEANNNDVTIILDWYESDDYY